MKTNQSEKMSRRFDLKGIGSPETRQLNIRDESGRDARKSEQKNLRSESRCLQQGRRSYRMENLIREIKIAGEDECRTEAEESSN